VLKNRESNEVAQAVDRHFSVTAVLSGWENVAASQEDAFSWRTLAEHLSTFSCTALMIRALKVICVFNESILDFYVNYFFSGDDSNCFRHRVPPGTPVHD